MRAVDVFVDGLDLDKLGFVGVQPLDTGRPAYHPGMMLKLYIYGYLNRVPSSRRLERECQRNIEMIWLTGQLAPDFKTIADFRKDNGPGIKKVCARFVEVCRKMGLLATASVAIDGSKFKAVNNRDKNFTRGKVERRRAQLEESVARYLAQLDTADRQEPSETLELKKTRIKNGSKIWPLKSRNSQPLKNRFWRRPISRYRSPIPTAVRWPRAAVVPASSATTCRRRSIQKAI